MLNSCQTWDCNTTFFCVFYFESPQRKFVSHLIMLGISFCAQKLNAVTLWVSCCSVRSDIKSVINENYVLRLAKRLIRTQDAETESLHPEYGQSTVYCQ